MLGITQMSSIIVARLDIFVAAIEQLQMLCTKICTSS